ncbi:MAG TPA: HAD-IB family phosphatase [Longimicrobiales bacterium]
MPRFGTVIFDCDSTLSTVEGIEELAAAHRAEVAALTEAAMRGVIPLEEVYAQRLAAARPSRARVEALGRRYIETLVADARETVAVLLAERIDVRILSGGLAPAVLMLARALAIPEDRVAAVDVRFDDAGEYAGYDAGSPLAYAGGKRVVIERWAPELVRPIMMVGDGATDLETRPVVDLFVAFAGVIERPAVTAAAEIVVRSPSLAPILPLALGGAEPDRGDAAVVFSKGVRLLEW